MCLLRIRINRFWEGALHCHQSTEGVSDTAFVTDFQVEVCENGSHQDAKHKPELLKELKQNLVIMTLAIQTRIPRTIPASLCLDESYGTSRTDWLLAASESVRKKV